MSISDTSHNYLLARTGAVLLGSTLVVAGLLGIVELHGAGGRLVLLFQLYGVIAILGGAALIYAGLVAPDEFKRTTVFVLRVGAGVVIGLSLLTGAVGVIGNGELAPFFVVIGIIGLAVAFGLGVLVIFIKRTVFGSMADET
ncbi:hypothetical protein [Salinigranum salinum]|uniref:hypothetical protein n=1 Tax=Salinigranum salinum TaxID=1364937 RepID=UPI00126077C6|nr:hypothetical protein [Salinigranum salinum]